MIQVHRDLNKLPKFKNAVITIGSFDGVHLGHLKIINQLKAEAAAINGETVIITFHPHPRKIIEGGHKEVKIINTLDEKIKLLDAQQIEHLVVVPFNEAFSNQTPGEYVEHFLVEKFHPHTIIIGYDHRFGKNRAGDYHLLEDLGDKFNYQVKEIHEQLLNEIIISSTKVREALVQCDAATAHELLGYHYFFSGKVIEGNKLGRTIGYPTANLQIHEGEKLIPGDGIYAVEIVISNTQPESQPSTTIPFKGMLYIGNRPVLGGTQKTIEVNIFDFADDIYGQTITVIVHAFIRNDVPLNGMEDLKAQLGKDKEIALQYLHM